MLQASHGEPSLRHTLIAISTLHEEFSKKSLAKVSGAEIQPESLAFALNQYTKALGHLRRSLASGKQAPLTALMSCLLFVCFDSLRGFYRTAMVCFIPSPEVLGSDDIEIHWLIHGPGTFTKWDEDPRRFTEKQSRRSDD